MCTLCSEEFGMPYRLFTILLAVYDISKITKAETMQPQNNNTSSSSNGYRCRTGLFDDFFLFLLYPPRLVPRWGRDRYDPGVKYLYPGYTGSSGGADACAKIHLCPFYTGVCSRGSEI